MNFFFIVLKLLIYAWHLVLVVQFINNDDLRPLVHFFFLKNLTVRTLGQCSKVRTVHIFCSLCMEFGLLTLSSDTYKVLKKIWRSRTSLLMNKILISENALTKWYLLGSIEFLATLKCLIIICCFLPAEFWQKYAEVFELTGHVRTSGFYGT